MSAYRPLAHLGVWLCLLPVSARAQDTVTSANFAALHKLIRPQEGESRWRSLDWLTSLHEGRVKAAAEGKPILLWSGGGAPPTGGC